MQAGTAPSEGGFELDGERTAVGGLVKAMWSARGLIGILARKDFYVRYRRASLGMVWAVGIPLIQAVVLAVVFSRIAGRRAPGGSYAAYILSGLVAWTYFSTTLGAAATAIVDGKALSSRTYFPRAVLPLASMVANLYSFAATLAVTIVIILLLGVSLGPEVLLLGPASLLLAAFTAGLGLVVSALHVYFRDIRYLVTAITAPWFYLTPVIYPIDLAPENVRPLIQANPMTGVVELFRAATVGASPDWAASVAVAGVATVLLWVAALSLHSRFDRVFADLL